MNTLFDSCKNAGIALMLSMVAVTPALAQSTTSAYHGAPVASKPPFPSLSLSEVSNGETAIANLGVHLPAVAAYYGKTASEFAQQLRHDRSAWIDKSGRLFFVEHAQSGFPTQAPAKQATPNPPVKPCPSP